MGLRDLFKRKPVEPALTQKDLDAAVQDALKNAVPSKSDADFARTKEIIHMVNSMSRANPQQDMSGFFQQLMSFEKMKQGIIDIENSKLDKLAEEIEQAQGSEDGTDEILNTLLQSIGGLKAETKQQSSPFSANPHEFGRNPVEPVQQASPQPPLEAPLEFKDLPELDAIERAAVNAAAKKIPKAAAKAFSKKDELKKQAIVNAILDKIEDGS